jgi:type II secretory pathway pseudopilin PulG
MKNSFPFDRKESGECGTSLLETLVALTILMIGTVGVLTLFPLSMKLTSAQREYSLLNNRARDTAEVLLAVPWTDPELCAGNHRADPGDDHIGVVWKVEDRVIDSLSPTPPGRESTGGNLKVIAITAVGRAGTNGVHRDLTLVVMKGRD